MFTIKRNQCSRSTGTRSRALRSVADRLLAVACAMLKSQTTFDPEHAVEAVAA